MQFLHDGDFYTDGGGGTNAAAVPLPDPSLPDIVSYPFPPLHAATAGAGAATAGDYFCHTPEGFPHGIRGELMVGADHSHAADFLSAGVAAAATTGPWPSSSYPPQLYPQWGPWQPPPPSAQECFHNPPGSNGFPFSGYARPTPATGHTTDAGCTPPNPAEPPVLPEPCLLLSSARRSAASLLSAHQRRLYGSANIYPSRESGRCAVGTPSSLRSSRATAGAAAADGSRANNTSGSAYGARDDEDCCIAAVLHNGAKEVGVALMSFPALAIAITQFGDTSTFAKLLALLYGRNPVEILLAATTLEEPLTKILVDNFKEEMTFTSVPRRFFASERGVARLNRLKSSPEVTLTIEDTDRYLCVAAANALLTYVEGISDMQFMPGSVRVGVISLDDFMDIPRSAARALHIIYPSGGCTGSLRRASHSSATATGPATDPGGGGGARRRRSRGSGGGGASLFLTEASAGVFAQNSRLETVPLVEALPRPCTPMGQRLLRSNLLQPLKDKTGIEYRLDAVSWLVADPVARVDCLRRLLCGLSGCMDLERMSAMISYSTHFQPRAFASAFPPQQQPQPQQQWSDHSPGDGFLFDAGQRLNRQETFLQEQQQQRHLAAMFVERNKRIIDCLMEYWHVTDVLLGLERALTRLLPVTTPPTTTADSVVCGGEEQPTEGRTGDDGEEAGGIAPCGAKSAANSSPEEPYLLKHLLSTLRACELGVFREVLAHYLDGAVREVRRPHASTGTFALPTASGGGGGGSGGGGTVRQHSRLTRLCFAVKAAPGSSLDMARSRYSEQVRRISEYCTSLGASYQLFSLRLEVDATQLFCFSYAASEERKTHGGPFLSKFAGGNHFALYKRALHERERERQRQRQQQHQRRRHLSRDGGGDSDIREGSGHESNSGERSARTWAPIEEDEEGGDDGDDGDEEQVCVQSSTPPYLDPFVAQQRNAHSLSGNDIHSETSGGDGGSRRRARTVRVRCTTEELTTLCQEASEYLRTIFAEEVKEAEGLLSALRSRLGCIHAMTEAVSLLDMLLSFAVYTYLHGGTRPTLWDSESDDDETERGGSGTPVGSVESAHVWGTSGPDSTASSASSLYDAGARGACTSTTSTTPSPLAESAAAARGVKMAGLVGVTARRRQVCLRAARHPSQAPHQLAQRRGGAAALSVRATANTITWDPGVRVLIITGPNAAGKSTLLRILGQTYALAQSGCFVLCESAHLRLADRICTHMLCDELPSPQHSSQRRELMELAELTHAATARSLVLVDELGRSMLSLEGFTLAWSVVQWLQAKARCQAAFVTHFTDLAELSKACPEVANAHFTLTRKGGDAGVSEVARRSTDPADADTAQDGGAARWARTTVCCSAHMLLPGKCEDRAYGLKAAASLGFYAPVLRVAEALFATHEASTTRAPWTQNDAISAAHHSDTV